MPKQYTRIRDALVKRGTPYDEAQAIAAATYNKRHPGHPMKPKKHRTLREMKRHAEGSH